jgi:hypothetical protein
MASTYTPLATTTRTSSTNSITFSSISGSYTDLVLVSSIMSGNTNQPALLFELNGDNNGYHYSGTMIYGTGSAAGSNRQTNQDYGTIMRNGGLSTSSTIPQTFITHFNNYSNTTTYKTVISRNNVADTLTGADASLWRNSAAITSIRIFADTNAFASGSTFTLYGILAA